MYLGRIRIPYIVKNSEICLVNRNQKYENNQISTINLITGKFGF